MPNCSLPTCKPNVKSEMNYRLSSTGLCVGAFISKRPAYTILTKGTWVVDAAWGVNFIARVASSTVHESPK